MNEIEIARYLMCDAYTSKYFKGVMAYNELPKHIALDGLYIVNTDLSTGPGKHWVSVFINDRCEYFNSLGYPPMELKYFLENQQKTYVYSNKRIQGNGDVCGDYCILYSYFRCRGISMQDFVNKFTENIELNDILVELK